MYFDIKKIHSCQCALCCAVLCCAVQLHCNTALFIYFYRCSVCRHHQTNIILLIYNPCPIFVNGSAKCKGQKTDGRQRAINIITIYMHFNHLSFVISFCV